MNGRGGDTVTMDERPNYQSYLLRMWQTTDGDQVIWRASLDNPGTGERLSFASLEALFAFLKVQTAVDRSKEQQAQ